jgi:ribosomal protein S27E
MNEIECARCGWNWIMFEGQTEADCPFCPKELGGFVFVTET